MALGEPFLQARVIGRRGVCYLKSVGGTSFNFSVVLPLCAREVMVAQPGSVEVGLTLEEILTFKACF